MQRNIFALIVGTAVIGAAALAACSSGGGNSTSPAVSSNSLPPGASQLSSINGSKFTFTINRTPAAAKTHRQGKAKLRSAQGTRRPEYLTDQNATGLQIAVTLPAGVTGNSGITQYVDITPTSPLCTLNGQFETCTLTIPTIAATEKITVTEVDTTPTNEGSNGYGGVFPPNTHILAVGSTMSTTNGATSVSLGLGPVLANVLDAEDCGDPDFASLTTTPSTISAGFDYEVGSLGPNSDRIVVTAGVAQTITDNFCFYDVDGGYEFQTPPPVPAVDINGSSTPVTFVSNSQHVLVGIYDAATTPPPVPTSQTASMSDTSMLFANNCIGYVLKFDGNLTQPATLTVSNNLTAPNPYPTTPANYGSTEVVTIVPLLIVATPAPISQSLNQTTTVTASDYEGFQGMIPFGSVNSSGVPNNAFGCLDSSSNDRATLSNPTTIGPPNWQITFTITPQASPVLTQPVMCTFVLGDAGTGVTQLPGYVLTQPVTVTINP